MPDINMQHFEELQRNQHSIDVEIDASQVASPQQDFPMMLETPNSSNSMLNVVAINEFGEQLPTEIEGITNNKNWVHFKDMVHSGWNRKMKVFYGGCVGKPAADSTYGSQAVWDSNHDAVYLMNNLLDSTSNGRTGTITGSVTLGDGTYGKEYDFDGATSYIKALTGITAYPFTLTILMNLDTITNYDDYIFLNDWGDNIYTLGAMDYSQSPRKYTMYARDASTSDVAHGTTTAQTGIPQLLDIVFRSATDRELYLNGGSEITDATSVAFTASIDSLLIGNRRIADAVTIDGKVQQVRVLLKSKSVGEITTTHKNLNNPTAIGAAPFYKLISKEHNFVESLQSLGRAG